MPTQRIENGLVQFEVLYARVTAIRARGETRGAERKLQDYLGKLTENEIFDRNQAERYLLLARDLPGYNVQLTLKPAGTAPGELVGEVTVLRQPFTVDATIQNYAASATGPWGGQIRASAYGLTGLGDATTLSFYSTSDFEEQQILQASHEFRPGSEGLVLSGQFTYAWTRPDLGTATPAGVALEAETLFAGIAAEYPLRRSQGSSVWLGAGFDLINQDVDLIVPISRDRLRVLWARGRFDAVDLTRSLPGWRASGELELRQGLDILDATDGCLGAACPAGFAAPSRFDGRADATVIRTRLSGELALGTDFAFAFEPRAQYAFRPTLAFEEFTTGNYTVGRGYDPGALTGDSGVGLRTELRGTAAADRAERLGAVPALRLRRRGARLPAQFRRVGFALFGRRRRARRDLGPAQPRCRARGAAQGCRPARPARRRPLPAYAHRPNSALEDQLMSHSFPARTALRRAGRPALGCSLLALATALASPAAAQSQTGGSFQGNANVVFGSAAVTTGTGTTDVQVNSSSAVIDWAPFDQSGNTILFQPAGTTATFHNDPTGQNQFAVLNRIVPANTSAPIRFDGTVISRLQTGAGQVPGGTVFFYSPGGIMIGANAVFDVGNLGLTTAPPMVDANGGWYVNNTVQFGQAISGTAVSVEPGSQITAPQAGSYVTAFAPSITQGGAVSANGQIAYVAAEAGTMTFSPDGLFDIQVSIGSSGGNGPVTLTHSGTSGGPASSGAGDIHRIYMVAVPKNQAITLSITGGTQLGFDIAGAADVEGNTIVLSAGYNVSSGEIEAAPAATETAQLAIFDSSLGATAITSAVTSASSGQSIFAAGDNGTSFASDLIARAGTNIDVAGASGHQLSIAGDASFDVSRRGAADAGNVADVTLQASGGGSIVIDGNLTMLAVNTPVADSGTALDATDRTGGRSQISIQGTGSLIHVAGDVIMDAAGVGADSLDPNMPRGSGTGGYTRIDISGGDLEVGGSLSLMADGSADAAGFALSGGGGNGFGGTSAVRMNGGTLMAGELLVSARGLGGESPLGGLAGNGLGGTAQIEVANGSLSAGAITVAGDGVGGSIASASPVDGAVAGSGQGGNAYFYLNAATVEAGEIDISAEGDGGEIDSSTSTGVTGGNGTGGLALLQAQGGNSTLTASELRVDGSGTGGTLYDTAGTGGDGTGGEARIDALSGAALTLTAPIEIAAEGSGHSAQAGGVGGTGMGGRAYTFTSGGSLTFNGALDISARSEGGDGTTGGSATGGLAYIQSVTNGTTVLNGGASLSADAMAGFYLGGLATGGAATGGSAQILATDGNARVTISDNVDLSADATGGEGAGDGAGNGGPGGAATGGLVEIGGYIGSNGLNQANTVTIGGSATLGADGFGGTGYSSGGGAATGGRGYISGGQLTGVGIGGDLLITTDATGGALATNGAIAAAPGTSGGSATGGQILLQTYGTGGSIDIEGPVTLSSQASGGDAVNAVGDGGDAFGGFAQVFLQNGTARIGGYLEIGVETYGGAGDTGGDAIALANNISETGIFAQNSTVSVEDTAFLSAIAVGGAGRNGGVGGEAVSGTSLIDANSSANGASSITLADVYAFSSAEGGAGGAGTVVAGGAGGAGNLERGAGVRNRGQRHAGRHGKPRSSTPLR